LWHAPGLRELTPKEALSNHEINWRHVDMGALGEAECELIATLAHVLAGGRLLVRLDT